MRLLAVSGSIRTASSNTALLRAAAALAPAGVTITLTTAVAELPHFSPDLEANLPAAARAFRAEVDMADGLLFSVPEYAHGVPGSFKNALDWLVGGPEFLNKPVAFLNASARGTWALAAVKETVTVMTGRISEEGSYTLPLLGGPVTEERILGEPAVAAEVAAAVARFAAAIGRRDPSPFRSHSQPSASHR